MYRGVYALNCKCIKQNTPIIRSLWSSLTRKIYIKTHFLFESVRHYAKYRRAIISSLLRFWTFFIGGWIQFGVTVHVRDNKANVWAKQLSSQNPSHASSTPSKLLAILCEPCSQKSRFFLVLTAKFSSLYAGASRVPPRVLAGWAKTLRGQILQIDTSYGCNSFVIKHYLKMTLQGFRKGV